MRSQDYWQLFLETGAPEAYVSYMQMLHREESHVPDDPGHRAESHGLQ